MNLETEGKINLPVTLNQWFVTQSKLSLIFLCLFFFAYFSDNTHDAFKNANDSKFYITKLNP